MKLTANYSILISISMRHFHGRIFATHSDHHNTLLCLLYGDQSAYLVTCFFFWCWGQCCCEFAHLKFVCIVGTGQSSSLSYCSDKNSEPKGCSSSKDLSFDLSTDCSGFPWNRSFDHHSPPQGVRDLWCTLKVSYSTLLYPSRHSFPASPQSCLSGATPNVPTHFARCSAGFQSFACAATPSRRDSSESFPATVGLPNGHGHSTRRNSVLHSHW